MSFPGKLFQKKTFSSINNLRIRVKKIIQQLISKKLKEIKLMINNLKKKLQVRLGWAGKS